MLGNEAMFITLSVLGEIIALITAQSTSPPRQTDCVKPDRIVPMTVNQATGIWYFIQAANYESASPNIRCSVFQNEVYELSSNSISPFPHLPQSQCSLGMSSNFYINSSTNAHTIELYSYLTQEPGVFIFYNSMTKLQVTFYILKWVPNDRVVTSACYKQCDKFLDQFNAYFSYKHPKVDEQQIAADYEELGIKIRNSKLIPQSDPNCINFTFYGN